MMRAPSPRERGRTLDRLRVGSLDAGTSAFNGGTGLAPGLVVGDRYRLVAELGRGATGVVWSAVHVVTSAEVALKIIVEPDPSLRIRLVREARVCGGLRHKNVVEVYDLGETAAGQPFLVMQRLHGETLAELLARTPQLPGATAAVIGRDVARALAAAHALGVVHRDLKPANVYLHRAPGEDGVVVKVLDFGVCKVPEPGNDLRTDLGAPVGSLAYMAPEQAAGDPDVDGRADLWSLGVMLFEMLAGRRLFSGTKMNIVRQVLYDPIPRLAAQVPTADPSLASITDRCLAREREDRWGDASEVARALAVVCDHAERREGPRTHVMPPRDPRPSLPSAGSLPDPRPSSPAQVHPPQPETVRMGAMTVRMARDEPPPVPDPVRPPPPRAVVEVRVAPDPRAAAADRSRAIPGAHAVAARPAPLDGTPPGRTSPAAPAPSGLAALPSWFAAVSVVAMVVVVSLLLLVLR